VGHLRLEVLLDAVPDRARRDGGGTQHLVVEGPGSLPQLGLRDWLNFFHWGESASFGFF